MALIPLQKTSVFRPRMNVCLLSRGEGAPAFKPRGAPLRFKKGLTLLELLIAITLLTVVFLTAATLLSSFNKFYFDFVRRESDIADISLGVLEEIGNRIRVANRITITSNAASVDITVFVDNGTPDNPADDSMHEYLWTQSDGTIRYTATNPAVPWRTIAYYISAFSAALLPGNTVEINITISPSGGAAQSFKTTVVTYASAA